MNRLSAFTAAAFLSLTMTAGVAAADPIKDRQATMKATSDSMKAIKAALDGGNAKAAAEPAKAVAEAMKKAATLFPKGSESGETWAKPEIWAEWAKVEAGFKDTEKAAQALVAVAMAGDAGKAGDAFKALGGACGSCHKPYRKPKE